MHSMKPYGVVEVHLHSFLISALECGQLQAPAALSPGTVNRLLTGHQCQSADLHEDNCLPLPIIEPRRLERPSGNLVTVPTELPAWADVLSVSLCTRVPPSVLCRASAVV